MAAVAKLSPYRKREEGVALFIDWENLKISLQTVLQAEPDVQALLRVLDGYGQRGVSRAYADWQNHSSLHTDQIRLLMRSVETVQIVGRNPDTDSPIKNSADVALAVEATRTCYHHPDLTTFILVTGDGDLVHLVNELKRNRNRVIIVGVEGTISRLLQEAADEVMVYERDIEPHLSRRDHNASEGVDVDTLLEGIKQALSERKGSASLAELGRILGRKGISLRSSNYSLSELSDVLIKRGELEAFEDEGLPHLRLSQRTKGRSRSSRPNTQSTRSSQGNHNTSDAQNDAAAEANPIATSSSRGSSEAGNAWQGLEPDAQQHMLRAIAALEARAPFVTAPYLIEHLHQTLPDYSRDSLEPIVQQLIDENILQRQRQGNGREGRSVLRLNPAHTPTNLSEGIADEATTPNAPASRPTQAFPSLADLLQDKEARWERLQEAQQHKTVFEVVLPGGHEGLEQDINGVALVLPSDQLELTRVDDAQPYANKPLDVHILSVDTERQQLILSRSGVLAQRTVDPERLQQDIDLGREITAKVVSLNDYAAFIDLGGSQGFVHRSEIAEPEPSQPSQVLAVGDVVVAKALLLDWDNRKVQFSIKQAEQSRAPADTGVPTYNHDTDEAEVSEETLSKPPIPKGTERVQESNDGKQGHSNVVSEIQELPEEPKRLESSSHTPSWRDLKERYPEGRKLTGEVNNVLPYGAFITLEDGVSALLHKSELQKLEAWEADSNPQDVVAEGNHLDIVIKEHNEKRQHLILGLAEVAEPQRAIPDSAELADPTEHPEQHNFSSDKPDHAPNKEQAAPMSMPQHEVPTTNTVSLTSSAHETMAADSSDTIPPSQARAQRLQGMPIAREKLPANPPQDTRAASPSSSLADAQATMDNTRMHEYRSEGEPSPAPVPTSEPDPAHAHSKPEMPDAVPDSPIDEHDLQGRIIQQVTDIISHHTETYVPLTSLYHQLEQDGLELSPENFKDAMVRAHQGRKLRIVRHPQDHTLYAGLGVHATDELSEVLL